MTSSAATPVLSLGVKHQPPATQTLATRNYNLQQISKAVDADDDDSYQRSSFALKRTRSMGLLDQFVVKPPTEIVVDQSIQDETNISTPQKELNDTLIPTTSTPNNSCASKSPISTSSIESCDSVSSSNRSSSPSSISSSSASGTPDLSGVHDDSVLQYEPSRHVDYLSHDWKESDISSCWRNIVSRRRDVANSARLENASWRTWTKAKYNLRTVSPESVNWLKDCDITWLYGPLYNQPCNVYFGRPQDDSEVTKIQVPLVPGHKPILKKRTVSDKIFARQAGHSSRSPEVKAVPVSTDVTPQPSPSNSRRNVTLVERNGGNGPKSGEGISYLRHHNYRHRPHTGQSDENISRQINLQYRHVPGHLLAKASSSSGKKPQRNGLVSSFSLNSRSSTSSNRTSLLSTSSCEPSPAVERHIHFNDRVEQCIAVEKLYTDDEHEAESQGRRNRFDLDDSDESDEEGGMGGREFRHWGRNRSRYNDYSDDDSEDDDDEGSDSEDDDEPGLFLKLRSGSTSSTLSHNLDRLNGLKSASTSDIPHTIAFLPATTLKCSYDETEQQERLAEEITTGAYALSHNTQRRKHIYSGYDYNSVFESPNSSPGGNAGLDPNTIARPSSILEDIIPSSVAMPSHLCAELFVSETSDEVVLPPVRAPLASYEPIETKKAEDLPVVSIDPVQEILTDSSLHPISSNTTDSEDPSSSDLPSNSGVTSRISHAVTSAKDFAQGIWSSGWSAGTSESQD